jgi:hypothetical protein
MEWPHCRIARQPASLSERRNEIPASPSAIVMKLLSKSADDRYQTAAGLAADLRRCQAQWQAHGCIGPFPLGANDVSDRLLIPERLFGREREIDALIGALDRVAASSATEFVLVSVSVSGYSGVGESTVVPSSTRRSFRSAGYSFRASSISASAMFLTPQWRGRFGV